MSTASEIQNISISDVVVPLYGGLRVGQYVAKIRVGTPAVEFRVQVDTGSSLLMIRDVRCHACGNTLGLLTSAGNSVR